MTPNVRITGVRPFVEAVKRALDAVRLVPSACSLPPRSNQFDHSHDVIVLCVMQVKAAGATNPELLNAYNSLKTAGGLCCRPIKRSNGTPGMPAITCPLFFLSAAYSVSV